MNHLEDANSEKRELEEVCHITQLKKILLDKNDHYHIAVKMNEEEKNFITSSVTIMGNDTSLYKMELEEVSV